MNIEEEVTKLLMNKYGWSKEEIVTAKDFEALGLDSLSLYSLVTECEEMFGVKVDTDDITEINSLTKFVSYLRKG